MKRMDNYQWPLTLDASLDSGRTSEKWPLHENLNIVFLTDIKEQVNFTLDVDT